MKEKNSFWVWWHIAIIPAFGWLGQEDCRFEAILGYIVRPCVRKGKKKISGSFAIAPQVAKVIAAEHTKCLVRWKRHVNLWKT
jgi:hypothetical protein